MIYTISISDSSIEDQEPLKPRQYCVSFKDGARRTSKFLKLLQEVINLIIDSEKGKDISMLKEVIAECIPKLGFSVYPLPRKIILTEAQKPDSVKVLNNSILSPVLKDKLEEAPLMVEDVEKMLSSYYNLPQAAYKLSKIDVLPETPPDFGCIYFSLGNSLYKFIIEINLDPPRFIDIIKTSRIQHQGLENEKADCYLNSILQVLAHTPYLYNDLYLSMNDNLAKCLLYLMICMKYNLAEKDYMQKYFMHIINTISSGYLANGEQKDTKSLFLGLLSYFKQQKLNLLIDLFAIEIVRVMKFSCGHENTYLDQHPIINLGAIHEGTCVNYKLGNEYMQAFELKDLYGIVKQEFSSFFLTRKTADLKFCLKCQNRIDCTEEYSVSYLPKVVCAYIDNVNTPCFKISEVLKVDLGIMKFNLYAVISRVGRGASNGHYISYCREEKEWVQYNDSSVEIVSMQTKIIGGYLLFYKID